MQLKKRIGVCAAAVWLAAAPAWLAAQGFPSRPVTMIIPFAAGGPTDALGRVLAQSMGNILGQRVIVENVTGGGGTLARQKTAQAQPDGYTVLLAGLGTATSVTLYRKLAFDPVRSFDTVGLAAKVPMVLVGRKDLPAKNVGEVLRYITANQEKVTYGDGGLGSGSQFCGLLLMSALNAKMTTVSYRGSGPAMLDLLGGRVDLLCDQTTTTLSHISGGSIKGYAVTTKTRVPTAPELPTLNESGLREFELSNWYGLMLRKGTPRSVVDQLAAGLRAAIADPMVLKRLSEFGAIPAAQELAAPDAFAAFFRAEVDKWAPIIKAAGVYAD
jgi:tripartite-type tricarboxylate transporter receptor subunit TctC